MNPMTTDREDFLRRLLAAYKALLGEFEPSPAFVPGVWRAIEARRERGAWRHYLIAWSPRIGLAAVAVAVLLIASQWLPLGNGTESALIDSSYVDVLAMDSMDEEDGALWVLAENGR